LARIVAKNGHLLHPLIALLLTPGLLFEIFKSTNHCWFVRLVVEGAMVTHFKAQRAYL